MNILKCCDDLLENETGKWCLTLSKLNVTFFFGNFGQKFGVQINFCNTSLLCLSSVTDYNKDIDDNEYKTKGTEYQTFTKKQILTKTTNTSSTTNSTKFENITHIPFKHKKQLPSTNESKLVLYSGVLWSPY